MGLSAVGFSLMWALIDHTGIFDKYRIQEKYPPSDLIRKAWVNFFANLPIMWAPFYIGYYFQPNLEIQGYPSFIELVPFIIFCALVEETGFYWSHRMLHQNPFYPLIHKQHHDFHQVVGISFQYSHPVENSFNILSILLGPALFGKMGFEVKIVSIWAWYVVRIWETAEAHSGYDVPFSPFALVDCSRKHEFHHSQNIGNYGSFFGVWDYLCGTDAAYRKFRSRQKIQ